MEQAYGIIVIPCAGRLTLRRKMRMADAFLLGWDRVSQPSFISLLSELQSDDFSATKLEQQANIT
jgi:hypothetical protein